MGDDQVVARGDRIPDSRIGAMHADPARIWMGAAFELCKHGMTCIDRFNVEVMVLSEQARCKSSVAIPDHQGSSKAGIAKLWKERAAALPKPRAKGEPFQPAVDAREAIEIRNLCRLLQRRFVVIDQTLGRFHATRAANDTSKTGVSKTRSAAARSARGVRRPRK